MKIYIDLFEQLFADANDRVEVGCMNQYITSEILEKVQANRDGIEASVASLKLNCRIAQLIEQYELSLYLNDLSVSLVYDIASEILNYKRSEEQQIAVIKAAEPQLLAA